METKSERQIQTEAIAKQLQIPESLMKGIVIPENSDINEFLTSYKNDIDNAGKSQGKKVSVTGNAQEQEFASCLLKELAVEDQKK